MYTQATTRLAAASSPTALLVSNGLLGRRLTKSNRHCACGHANLIGPLLFLQSRQFQLDFGFFRGTADSPSVRVACSTMAAVAALVDEVDKKQTTGTTQINQAEPVKAGATVLEVAASAARRHINRLHLSRIPRSFQHHWQTFSSWIWYWVEELFEVSMPVS